jgi:dihydrofolate reductase
MKTQFYTATTLDGFIATEDDSLDWLFALGDPTDSTYPAFIEGVGALAMGSVTYEWVLDHSREVIASAGSAWPYTQPTWVFTHRKLKTLPGADIRFVSGDVRDAYDAMRSAAAGKNLWVVGGGELVGQFHDAGLLDEIIVQIGSAILGTGKPLLPRRLLPPALQLQSVARIGAEFVELRYAVHSGRRSPTPDSG